MSDASRIERIAKSIIADENPVDAGKASFQADKDTVNVTFSINTNKTDVFLGWMDSMLGKKKQLMDIAGEKGIKLVDGVNSNASFSLSFKSKQDGADIDGFAKDLFEKYNCKKN